MLQIPVFTKEIAIKETDNNIDIYGKCLEGSYFYLPIFTNMYYVLFQQESIIIVSSIIDIMLLLHLKCFEFHELVSIWGKMAAEMLQRKLCTIYQLGMTQYFCVAENLL